LGKKDWLGIMNAVALLETITSPRTMGKGLLLPELVSIPVFGASDTEIKEEEATLGKSLSEGYRRFLRRWNGIDLDVIRLYGAGSVSKGIGALKNAQLPALAEFIAIGSDPAGFVYAEGDGGKVYSFDHDGGEIECIARDFDAFIVEYVFGKDSAAFMGDDWRLQVTKALHDGRAGS
jgi:hypothetical protein